MTEIDLLKASPILMSHCEKMNRLTKVLLKSARTQQIMLEKRENFAQNPPQRKQGLKSFLQVLISKCSIFNIRRRHTRCGSCCKFARSQHLHSRYRMHSCGLFMVHGSRWIIGACVLSKMLRFGKFLCIPLG